MTTLLEWKERAKIFYAKYDLYLIPVTKFIVALAAFITISANIGYMEKISTLPVSLILALLCSVLPGGATIFFSAAVILADMYTLSLEVFLTTAVVFLIVALLYLRFAPKTGYMMILTPICFNLHIPYIVPAAEGMLYEPGSMVSVMGGTFIYYFLNGIKENQTALATTSEDEVSATSRISTIVKQVTSNREMILVLLVFVLMMILVYIIRRMSVTHAWTIAIATGFMVEFIILFGGFLIMGYSNRLIWILLGNIICVPLAFVIKFFFFNLDYKRTERVQFEDDDYYYYVKAVPKIAVQVGEKQVTKFNSKSGGAKKQPPKNGEHSNGAALNRKQIAKELDIDEDILDL